MLKQKVKSTLISYYNQQRGDDSQLLGRAIDWRYKLIDSLNNSSLDVNERISTISGFSVIQRQIEFELDLYQDKLQELSVELEQGDISQAEFEDRLENMTIAILALSFLAGSEIQDQALSQSALATLELGGVQSEDLDFSNLPEQAQADLNSEIAIALNSATGLSDSILNGEFEDRQDALFSRLAMWATTALGIVSLGKLYLDESRYQIWLYSPLKAHCVDCAALNGQVHTIAEWNNFFARTGKRPQSRSLACGGWRCGCGLFDSEGPSVGIFP